MSILMIGGLAILPSFATDGPPQPLRGFVSEETLPGLFTFRRCQGQALVPRPFLLNDHSPGRAVFAAIAEVRKSRQELDRPLYVELRGDATDKLVNARRFERAIGHVESCRDGAQGVVAGARLHAEGDDPAWRFVATPAAARLDIPGRKPIRFPAASFTAPQTIGKSRVFDAWSSEDGGSIRIEITEGLCVHSGKETAYGARVVARLGSESFEGCAARY